MKEFDVIYRCQLCGLEPVSEMGLVCSICQYEVMVEAILDTAFMYRDNPDNDSLKEELFDALKDYELWLEVDEEEED